MPPEIRRGSGGAANADNITPEIVEKAKERGLLFSMTSQKRKPNDIAKREKEKNFTSQSSIRRSLIPHIGACRVDAARSETNGRRLDLMNMNNPLIATGEHLHNM